MLRHAGAEGVRGQRILAAQQLEILRRDRQVQDAFFCAYGAVALRQLVEIDTRAKPDAAAVTPALTQFQHRRRSR